jgi:hypothetical protein
MDIDNNDKSIKLNENNIKTGNDADIGANKIDNNNIITTDHNNITNKDNDPNNNKFQLYNKKLYLNKDFKEIKKYNISDYIKLTINKKLDDDTYWFDIRKYYNNKPTKKGILLTINDLNKLKTIIINNLNTY